MHRRITVMHPPLQALLMFLPLGISLVIMVVPLTMLTLLAKCPCLQPFCRGLALLSACRRAVPALSPIHGRRWQASSLPRKRPFGKSRRRGAAVLPVAF